MPPRKSSTSVKASKGNSAKGVLPGNAGGAATNTNAIPGNDEAASVGMNSIHKKAGAGAAMHPVPGNAAVTMQPLPGTAGASTEERPAPGNSGSPSAPLRPSACNARGNGNVFLPGFHTLFNGAAELELAKLSKEVNTLEMATVKRSLIENGI
jgi:hypothetical protein